MIDRPIHVKIDRLVLSGRPVTPEEAAEIRAAVEARLSGELAGTATAPAHRMASQPGEPGTPYEPGHISTEIARAISPAIELHAQTGGD